MLTSDQLRAIMPHLPVAKHATVLPALNAAAAEFSFEAPARLAAFLSQVAHESAEFRFMEEIWGPTPAQKRYEPQSTLAQSLGNTDQGDGLRFKGRGVIQLTGRANYRKFGQLLGVDLEATPTRAASPELAFRIAGLYWQKKGLNELADRSTPEAYREITRRINGGFNGLAERERFHGLARTVLGLPVSFGAREPLGAGRARSQQAEPTFERGWEAITRKRVVAKRTGKARPRKVTARGSRTKPPRAAVRRRAAKTAGPRSRKAGSKKR